MPGLLSAIPGLSNLPNPLNLFNSDDSPSSPSQTRQQLPPTSLGGMPNAEAGPSSKFATMLSKGFDALTMSNPTTPVRPGATAPTTDSGSPTPMRPALRTEVADGSSSSTVSSARPSPPLKTGGTNVVIADRDGGELDGAHTLTEAGRRRGLSSASRGSGGNMAATDPRRRNRRVETFVLVKPPPTSSKNPLNLQVQLVVPPRTGGRPRGGSDAAAKAMIPPLPTASTSTTTTDDISSAPSTPARQSFEAPPTAEKVASGVLDATTSTPSVTSEPLSLPDECTPLPTVPEDQAGAKLRRRSSTGSQISTSAASMISSASGKQRIVPLYNLAVHNVVQPTIVTDAGTDSKVAKFLKRSLDISGVGILEPSEIWLPLHNSSAMPGNSPRPSFDPAGPRIARPASMISNMSLLSPAVTRVEDPKRASVEAKPLKLEVRQDDGPKKFFGKIFRKRVSAEPLAERRASIAASKSTTLLASEAGSSLKVPATPPQPAVHFNGGEHSSQVGHPTFGLAPAMLARSSSSTHLDQNGAIVGLTADVPKPVGYESEEMRLSRSGRPIGYTWTVRRWAKKNTEGWAAHIVAAAAAGLDMVANSIPGDGADEVVFEWIKMRVSPSTEGAIAALRRHPASDGADLTKRRRSNAKGTPSPSPGGSPTGSRVNLAQPGPGRASRQGSLAVEAVSNAHHLEAGTAKRKGPASPSPNRRVSPPRVSPTAASSDDVSSGDADVNLDTDRLPAVHEPELSFLDDDGYDSDPEDSETPWVCSVWVKRTGQRQLLATLTPAPHHPKVIAVLRIPNQLKGVSLTDLPSNPPPQGRTAQSDLAARVRDEVCLTEENLKDVVSVTAMWLVAREEFSGFGRKDKRKT